jgi:AcrR family transcriptional regulator
MIDEAAAPSRPRLEARRRAFLDAASAVFLEKGYANATLDDVIARSGGSRQTLYSCFGGKQGLFEAIVEERVDKIFASFTGERLLAESPDVVLVDVGTHYLETVLTPDALGMYRLVVAEGNVMREIAERFWTMGPGRSRTLLADYFAQQHRRGTLRIDDPELAAQQFWGMLLGTIQLQCLLGVRPAPDRPEIETFVHSAVRLFLAGSRPMKR